MIRRWILVIVVAVAAVAQQSPAPARPAGFEVAGVVVDESSSTPLPQTRVMLTPSAAQNQFLSFITAADGRFRFRNLPPGKYMLRAERHGYPPQLLDFHFNYTTGIVVGPELDSEHVVFRMRPAASIVGRITDDFHEPLRNVSVMLFFTAADGSRATHLVRTVQTDDQGVYRMIMLTKGTFYIVATGRPWYADYAHARHAKFNHEGQPASEPDDRPRSPLDVAYPITFYPGVTGYANASPITVEYGQRFTADFQLHSVPALHVRLRRQGAAEGLGRVTLQQRLFDINEVAVASQASPATNDEWEVSGFAPGRYLLEIAHAGASALRSEVEWLGDTTVDVNALEAEPTMANVAGAIKFDGTMDRGRKPDIVLRNVKTNKAYRQSIAADGTFELHEPLPPATYEVGIDNAPGFFVWGISAGGAEVDGTRLTIARAQPIQLSVLATKAIGTIEGSALRDGLGTAGMMIVLVPQNPKDVPLYRRDQSDSDGTFALRSVLPGRYTILALQTWDVEWSNPEFLQKYLAAGKQVQVIGGDTLHVTVAVQ